MTQQYIPVAWQDETTSQQGTLINAERLNQMQQAHHFADGFEEVDAIPTADPGVSYHKIVYCTADSTIYRWDGTEWTKDIDDETKALLQQEIARATAAESTLRGQLEDEHDARVDAEAAINDRITDEATELAQRIATETSTRYTADTALGTRITNETSARETADTGLGNRITAEATARADADTALGGRIDTEQARAEAAEQANAQAIANTYTKAEIDTALAGKADVATTYTKTETDALLALKADQATTYTKTETDALLAGYVTLNMAQTIPGAKTFSGKVSVKGLFRPFIVYGEYTHDANTVYPQRVRPITIFPSQNSIANPIGRIETVEDADRIGLELSSTNYDTGTSNGMIIWTDKTNGAKYTTIPNLPSTTSADMVPNLNYISQTGNSAPNNLLHRTGNETATGYKKYDNQLDSIKQVRRIVTGIGGTIDQSLFYTLFKVPVQTVGVISFFIEYVRFDYTSSHFKVKATLRIGNTPKVLIDSMVGSSAAVATNFKIVTAIKDNEIYVMCNVANIQYASYLYGIDTYLNYNAPTSQPAISGMTLNDLPTAQSYPSADDGFSQIADAVNSTVIV